jgi:hypothetical protein
MVFIGPEDHHDHPARDPRALRACFRRYWRWKSRPLGGRPQIDVDLRALIRQIGLIKSTNYVIAGIGFGESEKNAGLQIRSAKYELRLIGYGLQSRIVKQSSVIACGHLFCGRRPRQQASQNVTNIDFPSRERQNWFDVFLLEWRECAGGIRRTQLAPNMGEERTLRHAHLCSRAPKHRQLPLSVGFI